MWFDKSFSITCATNGHTGINAEHSWADGAVSCHLTEEANVIEHLLVEYNPEDGTIMGDVENSEPNVKCLTWTNLT